MLLPNRHGNSSEYRYGFNGMEKDDEVKGEGNSYTTHFRQYDTRVGRWLSLDPAMMKYPEQTPYAAFNNNPMFFTDPFGDDPPEDKLSKKETVTNTRIFNAEDEISLNLITHIEYERRVVYNDNHDRSNYTLDYEIIEKTITTQFVVNDFGTEIPNSRLQIITGNKSSISKKYDPVEDKRKLYERINTFPFSYWHKDMAPNKLIYDESGNSPIFQELYDGQVEVTNRMKQVQSVIGNYYKKFKGTKHINMEITERMVNTNTADDYTVKILGMGMNQMPIYGRGLSSGLQYLYGLTKPKLKNLDITEVRLHNMERHYPQSPYVHMRKPEILKSRLDKGGDLHEFVDN